MKPLLIGLSLVVAQFAAAASAAEPNAFQPAGMRPAAHPALYSFADVYRLTVGGAIAAHPALDAAPEAPLRVGTAPSQGGERPGQAEPRFTIGSVPHPDKWLLLVAGFALAGWVAHRRLVHPL
jgi:hypothetical protein